MGAAGTPLPALLAKASHVAGDRSFTDLSFRPKLELLLDSCDATAVLNDRGRQVLHSIVVRHDWLATASCGASTAPTPGSSACCARGRTPAGRGC